MPKSKKHRIPPDPERENRVLADAASHRKVRNMKPEAITNWNSVSYSVTPRDVYITFVTKTTLDALSVEVIDFRPPRQSDLFLSVDCRNAMIAPDDFDISDPRLILRRKEKKYRYVTDGVERLPKCGEWYRFLRSWLQASLDHTEGGSEPQLCFTREEVPE